MYLDFLESNLKHTENGWELSVKRGGATRGEPASFPAAWMRSGATLGSGLPEPGPAAFPLIHGLPCTLPMSSGQPGSTSLTRKEELGRAEPGLGKGKPGSPQEVFVARVLRPGYDPGHFNCRIRSLLPLALATHATVHLLRSGLQEGPRVLRRRALVPGRRTTRTDKDANGISWKTLSGRSTCFHTDAPFPMPSEFKKFDF